MVQINFAQKEIQCKIVYYGPGMSGKTTNLEIVHGKVPEAHRGELTSIATTGERTLYFDYMPLDLGQIAGIRTKFQLYTVPGQIYYKSTRRLVLQGVDGIVFVADSSRAKLRENKESLADLEENLQEMGKSLRDLPILIQYNKRDLPDAMTMEELEREVNPHGLASIEAIATRGEGVFPTLKKLAGMVLESVNQGGVGSRGAPPARPVRVQQAPAGAAQPAATAPAATATAPAIQRAHGGAPAPAPATGPRPPAPAPLRTAAAATAAPPGLRPTGTAAATAAASATAVVAAPAPAARPVQPAAAPMAGAVPNRAIQDRVVHVAGLTRRRTNSKLVVVLALAATIAAAGWWLMTRT